MALLKKPSSSTGGLKKPMLAKPGLKSSTSLKKPGGLAKPGKVGEFGGSTAKHKVSKGGAFAQADKAQAKQDLKRATQYRGSVPIGESLEVYFLDRGEPYWQYEHSLGGNANKAGEVYPCIKDTNENCPCCNVDPKGEGYFIMLLTAVIPKVTITKKSGETQTYHFQKKEWPIKVRMSKKYRRLYEAHGTFRGMVVKVTRDAKLDPSTGNDIEFVRMMSEKEIKQWDAKFGKGKDPQKQSLIEPLDFATIHKLPSAEQLADMIGASNNAAGSADFGKEDNDDDEFSSAGSGWGE